MSCLGCCGDGGPNSVFALILVLAVGDLVLSKAAGKSRLFILPLAVVSLINLALVPLLLSPDLQRFLFSRLCLAIKSKLLDQKRCEVLSQARGRVMELGPGPGVNFECYKKNPNIKELHLVEPNKFFEPSLNASLVAAGLSFPVRIHWLGVQEMGDVGEHFDTILATHVLCSVPSLKQTLAFVERSLRSGGKYLVFEHVRASRDNPIVSALQTVLQPVFYIAGAGCTFRDLETDLRLLLGRRFSFALESWSAPLPVALLKPHLVGALVKK